MKSKLIILSLAFNALMTFGQSSIIDFETFTLTPNSAYSPTTSTPFQAANTSFQYEWDNQWDYWSGGFAYTNIKDSSTAGFLNQYGVRAFKGYNSSSTYIVGLDEAKITLTSPQTTVNGFYVTNTTYAYKSMLSGDMFARKFGDTTGTGSGTTIAQGSYPDYFKLIVKGYKNGQLKNDSVTVFLANFTFTNNSQDFILDTWQYVNTSILGTVDSLQFFMRSSDIGQTGINTPLYFAIDNFESSAPATVGISEYKAFNDVSVFPNPFSSSITIHASAKNSTLLITDVFGKIVYMESLSNETKSLDLLHLTSGVYYLEIGEGEQKTSKKIIKN